MPLLDIDKVRGKAHRLVVSGLNELDAQRVSVLPGAYQRDDSTVSFPVEPLRVSDLHTIFQERMKFTDAAWIWWEGWLQRETTNLVAAEWTDAETGLIPNDTRLYPYQRAGVWWLRTAGKGILGDEMGLGKTIQALMASYDARKVLVVTVNLAKDSVWRRHIEDPQWLGRRAIIADGSKTQRVGAVALATAEEECYLVINHDMLQARFAKDYAGLYTTRWDTVIFDEAHLFQDPMSSRSLGAQKLLTTNKYLLTGTPIWNRPESVFGLLRLINPERFASFWNFVEEYCYVVVTTHGREIVGVKFDKVMQLHDVIAPYLMRRLVAHVLPQLPEKRVEVITYKLGATQKRTYHELKKNFRLLLGDGTFEVESSVSKAFADLRRLCNTPTLLGLPEDGEKTQVILDLIDAARSEMKKVLVFTWHRDYADYLSQVMTRAGIQNRVLHGGVQVGERNGVLQDFQQGGVDVLIAGIALTATAIDGLQHISSIAIFAEGSYVPTHVQQAEARLHRIGQKTDVMIYRLQAEGTVEAAIWRVVNARADTSNELLAFREVIQELLSDQENP